MSSSVTTRVGRTLPAVLFAALPLLSIQRSMLVGSCDQSGMGLHDPGPPPRRRRPSQWYVRRGVGEQQIRLTAPSTATIAVVGALLAGMVLLALSDPRLSVYYATEATSLTRTVQLFAGWVLSFPSVGLLFGGNFVVALTRGMVGVAGLGGWSLGLVILLISLLPQVLWLYAVTAGLAGLTRRLRHALDCGTAA